MGNDATIQLFRILGGFLRMSFVGTLSRDTSHQRLDFGTLSSWWFEFAHLKHISVNWHHFPKLRVKINIFLKLSYVGFEQFS